MIIIKFNLTFLLFVCFGIRRVFQTFSLSKRMEFKKVCFVCHKPGTQMSKPCGCRSKFIHETCLIEVTVRDLDKPCAQCGHFYQGKSIVKRERFEFNYKIFELILASLVVANFLVIIADASRKDLRLYQYLAQNWLQLIFTLAFNLAMLFFIFKIVHRKLNSSPNEFYFNQGRMVRFKNAYDSSESVLLIRSNFGLWRTETHQKIINYHLFKSANLFTE